MVHCEIAVLLLVELQQRKLHHPAHREPCAAFFDQAELSPKLHPHLPKPRVHRAALPGRAQDEISRLCHKHPAQQIVHHRCVAEHFRKRPGDFELVAAARRRFHLAVQQTGQTVLLDKLRVSVENFPSCCLCVLLHHHRFGCACAVRQRDSGSNGRKVALFQRREQLNELHVETHVGCVDTEAPHGLVVRNDGYWICKGAGAIAERFAEYVPDEALSQAHDIVATHEGHFEIDLRKLRLAILAKILITEAARDLKVPIHAAHHEQLFVELWALR
mmetsp:Transcript_2494/g.6754  ORF Transcript_2494/g.6754 Transcript_2494/m.6754 type:complete len:274 (-) Transcript_2494:242-1063(-)